MSSKDNLALDLEHGVRRWDRARWISVFSSHNPTIREVTECLGLGLSASSSTTNRGIPKFDNPDYRRLSSEVTKLSKELPKERDVLLDFAADPLSLDRELEELLATYGPAIWGRNADRECLLKSDPSKKTYNKDLFYEEPEHKEILKIHLHRWIIIKACYYIRNMKLKRPSGANEYDTLADIDGESQMSPHGTPHSLSPPNRNVSTSGELDVNSINGKKRKSEAFGSLSDGEEHSATPAKRPYNTMPINRNSKSPRKTLHALLPGISNSRENVPPLPSQKHHLPLSPINGSDPSRIQLSTLSSNELNGVARPPSSMPGPGFTAVNTGGFTPVNNSLPARESPREMPRASSREPQQASPSMQSRDGRNYTSPYDTAPYADPAARPASEARAAPPPSAASAPASSPRQPLQAVNAAARPSKSESPAVQSVHHVNFASQSKPDAPSRTPQTLHSQPVLQPQPQPPPHSASSQPPQLYQQPPPPRPRSRADTPGSHHYGRSLAPHPSSRSNTPHAQVGSHPPPLAPHIQPAPTAAQQTAAAYNIQLVPTQPTPPTLSSQPPPKPPALQPAPPHTQQPAHHTQPPVHAPVLKSHLSDPASRQPPMAHPVQAAIPMQDLRMLQCEVTTLLIQYLFPKHSAPPPEPSVMQHLHTLWYHGESIFRAELGAHYDLTSRILTAWMQERAAISALQHSLAAQPGVPSAPSGLIDRLLAMNDLRVMRLKWKNMSTVDGMSPEDFLVKAFCAMTMTEGSEFMFKEGLNRVERGVFEWLRIEDAKIVVHRR